MKAAYLLATAVALATAAPALAHQSHTHDHAAKVAPTITVSCFRGPWVDVIWDRPNAVFVDSLVTIGYDFPTAHAIGERICRDEALVNNPDGLRSETLRVIRESPAR